MVSFCSCSAPLFQYQSTIPTLCCVLCSVIHHFLISAHTWATCLQRPARMLALLHSRTTHRQNPIAHNHKQDACVTIIPLLSRIHHRNQRQGEPCRTAFVILPQQGEGCVYSLYPQAIHPLVFSALVQAR